MEKHGKILNLIRKEIALAPTDHVYLYGSRARGDASPDSDWDILIVLDKPRVEQSDYDNISYPITALGWSLGEMIIPIIYTRKEWEDASPSPFYKNVTSERIKII